MQEPIFCEQIDVAYPKYRYLQIELEWGYGSCDEVSQSFSIFGYLDFVCEL